MAKDGYTLEELEEQIAKGGSVLHEGKLYRTVSALRAAFDTPESVEEEIERLEARKRELLAKKQSSSQVQQAPGDGATARSGAQSGDDLEGHTVAELKEKPRRKVLTSPV